MEDPYLFGGLLEKWIAASLVFNLVAAYEARLVLAKRSPTSIHSHAVSCRHHVGGCGIRIFRQLHFVGDPAKQSACPLQGSVPLCLLFGFDTERGWFSSRIVSFFLVIVLVGIESFAPCAVPHPFRSDFLPCPLSA